MNDIVEQLFFLKTHSEIFQHKTPSEKEKAALEKFDDNLTTEQRILFRKYDKHLQLRLNALSLELFNVDLKQEKMNK